MKQHWMRLAFFIILVAAFCVGSGSQSAAPSSPPPAQQADQKQETPGQETQQQPRPVYESATVLRATTRLVVVDVVATDSKGHVVPDLKADDFTLLEDGKEQQIRAFSFQHPPAAAARLPQNALQLPPNVFTNIPRYNVDSALNVILLDGLNTQMQDQAYARQQMLKFLETIPVGQPVAVYLLRGKLQLLQDFTTDPAALKAALRELKPHASALSDSPTGMEPAATDFSQSGLLPAQMQQSMQQFQQENQSFQTDLRVRYTLSAFSAIARSLSGYPGRKNLIWISDSFPININPDVSVSGDAFSSMRNYQPLIAATAEALIDSQVAVYSINAAGLTGLQTFNAAVGGGKSSLGGYRPTTGRNTQADISRESDVRVATHGTMSDIAQRTGGLAFVNQNDLDHAIAASIADGSTYYTLAYYPENKDWNGKFRKIHLKTSRKGVNLRHRLGYFATDPSLMGNNTNLRDNAFAEALSLDYPISTALKFEAGVLPPSTETQNRVLVNFALDPHAVSFEHHDDGTQHSSVDCVVQVYSEKGKLVKTTGGTFNSDLNPANFKQVMHNALPCQQFFDLPAGAYLLRLGVRDNHTGLIGTVNAKVTVDSHL